MACDAQSDLFGIEDEDAIVTERDFLGLPGGFVAGVGVLRVEAGVVVIGRDPLFDGLPGWLDGRNRGTDTLCVCRTLCSDLI